MSSVEAGRLQARLQDMIEREVGVDVDDPELDMLEAGLLDSLALLTVITAIERDFARELPLDDFDLDQFRSVTSITRFLRGLRSSGVGGWASVEL